MKLIFLVVCGLATVHSTYISDVQFEGSEKFDLSAGKTLQEELDNYEEYVDGYGKISSEESRGLIGIALTGTTLATKGVKLQRWCAAQNNAPIRCKKFVTTTVATTAAPTTAAPGGR